MGQSSMANRSGLEEDEDFDLMEGDIQKSIVNGIPSIDISERIHQLLTTDMENTVGLNLLGRNIGYSILHSKIYSIWKTQSPFKLIDIENDYFLAKFQNKFDREKVLSEGPWIIFGH
ncbi:hypothetical protein PVK06_041372 [Gossypium arboreum]|uniref:DUF4283 domain-containing protein n=1 Tax=Gossypium arboreum TaxID=29729 RepID=A0ABR0N828_GOSAR|nr:hypothetical protein PVK06_041372 [Gossypium arboreum]